MFGGDGMGEVDLGRGPVCLPEGAGRIGTLESSRSEIMNYDEVMEGIIRKKLGKHDRELDRLHRKRERLSENMQRRTEQLRTLMKDGVKSNVDKTFEGLTKTGLRDGDSHPGGDPEGLLATIVGDIADDQGDIQLVVLDRLAQKLDSLLEHIGTAREGLKKLETSSGLTMGEATEKEKDKGKGKDKRM